MVLLKYAIIFSCLVFVPKSNYPTMYKVISPPLQNFDNFLMVSTLIDFDSRRWKVDLVKSLFLPFEARTILNIPISYNLPNDKII